MMSALLSVIFMTTIKTVTSRNSIDTCNGVQEPGQNAYANTPFESYPEITDDDIIIPSQTYAINECNFDDSRHTPYSWEYTCCGAQNDDLCMTVFVNDITCNNSLATPTYPFSFNHAQREFNCDVSAQDCLLTYEWCSGATVNLVSGGCAPDYTTWGGFDGIYQSSICTQQHSNDFKNGFFTDSNCTTPTPGHEGGYNIVTTGDCQNNPNSIKQFQCYDTTVSCESGGDIEYYCTETYNQPLPCIDGQCDMSGNYGPNGWVSCGQDSDCDIFVGLDHCVWSQYCMPNCNNLVDGDDFCQSFFGIDPKHFCLADGRCGMESCDPENTENTCSTPGYFCSYRHNENNEIYGECVKSCNSFGGDGFCQDQHSGDPSYICQSAGDCDRDECVSGNCNSPFICDPNQRENGECIAPCEGNNTLCQKWNNYHYARDYFVCNNNFCETEYPICNDDTFCDGLGIQTWYGMGLRCDIGGSGRCYETQCANDGDCNNFYGGHPAIFCDATANVCKNLFEEPCTEVGCDWYYDVVQVGMGGYGIQVVCDITSDECDREYCDSTEDCDAAYFCLVYDQHICALKCNVPADCFTVFGGDNDTNWECNNTTNECVPHHDTGGGDHCQSADDCDTTNGYTCTEDNRCKVACINDNCAFFDENAVCKSGYCAVDKCQDASDCEEEYFNACYIDPTGDNECYRDCSVEDDCDLIFGQDTPCESGAPCNTTTDAGCVEVSYCNMFENYNSCVLDGCEDSEMCDIPSGICTIITCSDNADICRQEFNEFATCVDSECRANECLVDSDCVGRVNKCFTADPNDSNKCYSYCETDSDCTELYNQNGIECVTGDPAGVGVEITFCNVYDGINFTLNPTTYPTTSPITLEPTSQPSVCEEDGSLDTIDCDDDGCGSDEAYLSFDLIFSVCSVLPYHGKRVGLWNKISDCVCQIGLGLDDFDGTQIDFGDRRRLRGSSETCDLRITKYHLSLIDYADIDGCAVGNGGNSYTFEFGVEACGDCDALNNLWNGIKSNGNVDAVTGLVGDCAEAIGKEEMTDGFKVVKVDSFTYTFENDGKCNIETGGVVNAKFYNVLSVIVGVMFVTVVLN